MDRNEPNRKGFEIKREIGKWQQNKAIIAFGEIEKNSA